MWLNKLLFVTSFLICGSVLAEERLFIYPKDGQSKEQQEKDEYLCFVETKRTTNIDPNLLVSPGKSTKVKTRIAENPNRGGAEKGQAIGTITGAVIGHNNHHTVGGAIVGSIVGGIIGQSIESSGREKQRREAVKEAKEKAREQAIARATYREKLTIFNEHFSRCMGKKGYVVK